MIRPGAAACTIAIVLAAACRADAAATNRGELVSTHALSGGAALPSAAQNALIEYRTTAPNGASTVVTGTVAIPNSTPPPGGWTVVSWAHGTTGNAPQCAPSSFAKPDVEQRFLDALVAHGYVVAQTDYEGEGTPGIHPYFVGSASAHDVTDIVRAARKLDSRIGSRWIVMGHSEGGAAALWTAALGPSLAPELKLLGAVAYAPGSHITSSLSSVRKSTDPTYTLPLVAMMIEGIASADPSIRLEGILSPAGLALMQQLQARCLGELMNEPAWENVAPSSLFRPDADMGKLFADFWANEPGLVHPAVPVLLVQGDDDQLVPPSATGDIAETLEAGGAMVTFQRVAGATHDTVMQASQAFVTAWLEKLSGF